jgi:hypothetical protein
MQHSGFWRDGQNSVGVGSKEGSIGFKGGAPVGCLSGQLCSAAIAEEKEEEGLMVSGEGAGGHDM